MGTNVLSQRVPTEAISCNMLVTCFQQGMQDAAAPIQALAPSQPPSVASSSWGRGSQLSASLQPSLLLRTRDQPPHIPAALTFPPWEARAEPKAFLPEAAVVRVSRSSRRERLTLVTSGTWLCPCLCPFRFSASYPGHS